MPIVTKIPVSRFLTYDGANGAEILAHILGDNEPNPEGPYIESDDGVTLVIKTNPSDPEPGVLGTFRYGDGWSFNGNNFASREYLASEHWIAVSGGLTIH